MKNEGAPALSTCRSIASSALILMVCVWGYRRLIGFEAARFRAVASDPYANA